MFLPCVRIKSMGSWFVRCRALYISKYKDYNSSFALLYVFSRYIFFHTFIYNSCISWLMYQLLITLLGLIFLKA